MVTENILGYHVYNGTSEMLICSIISKLDNNDSPFIISCINPHSYVVALENQTFKTALVSSNVLIPDGQGIVIASKLSRGSVKSRISGPDLFVDLCKEINGTRGNLKCFFLGSTNETLELIKLRMAELYPNILVCGTYSPPFTHSLFFSELDNARIIDEVNKCEPDILFVGLTAPKQEIWCIANRDKLSAKVILPIGAAFNFFAGNVKRSHPVFQKLGLEWLPRLMREPRRLFKRNFVSTPVFLMKMFCWLIDRERKLKWTQSSGQW